MFDLVDHYSSGPKSELVYELPLTTWHPYSKHVIYSVPVDVQEGDLLVCSTQGEVTSQQLYNVMICCYIVLVKDKDDIDGLIVAQPYGENFTLAVHHKTFNSSGSVVVDSKDYRYVNVIGYAASTAARPNDTIKIEQDYGRLFILQYRERS